MGNQPGKTGIVVSGAMTYQTYAFDSGDRSDRLASDCFRINLRLQGQPNLTENLTFFVTLAEDGKGAFVGIEQGAERVGNVIWVLGKPVEVLSTTRKV